MYHKPKLKPGQIHKHLTVYNHLTLLFYCQLLIATFSVALQMKRKLSDWRGGGSK